MPTQAAHSPTLAALLTPPPIAHPWPGQGGIYAGIARGADGGPDQHLILSTVKPDIRMAWETALAWAKGLKLHGFTDYSLPTRDESALLYANLRDQFENGFHWTATQFSRDNAWNQRFGDGHQTINDKDYQALVRAGRRFDVQSLNHSNPATPSTADTANLTAALKRCAFLLSSSRLVIDDPVARDIAGAAVDDVQALLRAAGAGW